MHMHVCTCAGVQVPWQLFEMRGLRIHAYACICTPLHACTCARVQVPWQLFEMRGLRILNLSNCPKLEAIAVQFPLIPSQLEALILDG